LPFPCCAKADSQLIKTRVHKIKKVKSPSWSKNVSKNLKTRANNGFTIVELIVVVTVIGLLVAIAVGAYNGAYNKVVNDAKVTKSLALVNTLQTAKALFVADPKTAPALISTFNSGPDGNIGMIAPYTRVNGVRPTGEADLLAKSGMPLTLGTVDDSSFGGSNPDQAPTVSGYGL
jgi:prepilin-type N-terminal cleavage/methylation domain-containing protein